jgi:hypothetical protein
MVTATQAFAAVRARLNAGSYPYPLYYHGDDPVILPDAPTPFAFVVFNNEGSTAVSFGGGRGSTVYRNRARVEAFVFLPAWQGLEMAMDYAETVAVRLRSYRDDSISCFAADVIPVGHGSVLSVPGLSSEVSNYQCAIAECSVIFDQDGGGIVDVPPDTGGSTPDWVPANAKIHIDFLGGAPQGRAWSNGAAVAIDTLLGNDPNTVNGWGASGYDPVDLTADGLVYSVNPPAFLGVALSTMLSGATLRYQFKHLDTDFLSMTFALLALDGSDAIEIDCAFEADRDFRIYTWNISGSEMLDAVNIGAGAINAVATTITASRFEAAINGLNVLTYSDAHPDVVAAVIDTAVGGHRALQSITFYDPLPDTTGLSALSEIT